MAFIEHIHAAWLSWGQQGSDQSSVLKRAGDGPGHAGVGSREDSTGPQALFPSPEAVPEADNSLLPEHRVWPHEQARVGVGPGSLRQSLPF